MIRTALRRAEAAWPITVLAVVALGFAVRIAIIAHTRGGTDLRIYTYFSRLALHGVNPFRSPAHGLFPPVLGNSPPVEVAFFTGLLGIHDSPTTLRVVFALADAAVIWLIGMHFPRPPRWRLAMIVFYAFNPFVLFAWTAYSEDKTILFLGIAAWILALERGREGWAWAAGTGLAIFKFLGVFAAPSQALYAWRRSGRRAVIPVTAALAVYAVSNLPWFPASLRAFSRRDARLGIDPPIHASPTLLLSRIGLYTPVEAKVLTAVAVVLVFAVYVRRRLDIGEAVAWSLLAGYIFLPDDAFNRLLLVTLPFMLLAAFSARQWLAIWIVTCVDTLAGIIATHGVPHVLSGIGGALRSIFTREGTVPHVLWMNLLPGLVIALFLWNRARAEQQHQRQQQPQRRAA